MSTSGLGRAVVGAGGRRERVVLVDEVGRESSAEVEVEVMIGGAEEG
jgi:hypothetical protein